MNSQNLQSQRNHPINEAKVGDTLEGRYLLTEVIGRGASGAVFRATDQNLQRDVAIKILSVEGQSEKNVASRFEQEGIILRKLKSANTVFFYDYGQTDYHQPYIVMELVSGRSLKSVLLKEHHIAPGRAVSILSQVLSALSEAHSYGFIHRDLKPSNIMLCQRPGFPDDFVKVLDFGIAAVISDDGSHSDKPDMAGTPQYMAPEQFKNEPISPASDLYSIGCIGYEMLTGISAFEGDTLHVTLAKHLYMTPQPMGEELDKYPNLISTIYKLLEKKPEDRFQSAQEVISVLEHWEEPELTQDMLSYAIPVAEEFSLENSIETVPLQLPPDFASRLANLPVGGPMVIDDKNPKATSFVEAEDSIQETKFEVPVMVESTPQKQSRLKSFWSRLQAFILLKDFHKGERKYLGLALIGLLIVFIAIIIIIIFTMVSDDEEVTTDDLDPEVMEVYDFSDPDVDENSTSGTPSNTAADSKNDVPDSNNKPDDTQKTEADTNQKSDQKDINNTKSKDNKQSGKYPIFTFTFKYTPNNAKVSMTNAKGECRHGSCSITTTSTEKPANLVVTAPGYQKQRIVIKEENSLYSAKLKKQ